MLSAQRWGHFVVCLGGDVIESVQRVRTGSSGSLRLDLLVSFGRGHTERLILVPGRGLGRKVPKHLVCVKPFL